jgi:ribonuclease D
MTKLLIPKKLRAENILYLVKFPEVPTWIATYKDNTAIVYNLPSLPSEDEVDAWFNTIVALILEIKLFKRQFKEFPEMCKKLHKSSSVWQELWAHIFTDSGVWTAGKKGDFKFSSSNLDLWKLPEVLEGETKEYDKLTGAELGDALGMPSRLRYKQKLQVTMTDDFAFVQYPSASHYYWIKPLEEHHGVLHALTESTLDSKITVVNADDASVFGLIDVWTHSSDVLTIDTETFDEDEPNGWKALVGWLGKLRLLQIYSPQLEKTLIIDFGGRGQNAQDNIRIGIGAYLQEKLAKKTLKFQNALFDLLFLDYQLGLTLYTCQIKDSMLMSKSLWAGIGMLAHSLEAISTRLALGTPDKSLQKSDFGVSLVPAQFNYGADDVLITHRCVEELEKRLNRVGENHAFAALLNEYVHCCHMIRKHGAPINLTTLAEVESATQKYYLEKEALWLEESGLSATASSQAIVKWLDEQGIRVFNAQAGTLKELALTFPKMQSLLDAKAAFKRLGYIQGLRRSEEYRGDSCVTPGIQVQARQCMGRTSQGDLVRGKNVGVNLQNPSREKKEYPMLPDIRQVVCAPATHKLIGIDLSSSHLRFAVHYSGAKLALATMQPGEDIHLANAAYITKACESADSVFYKVLCSYKQLLRIKAIGLDHSEEPSEAMLKWAAQQLAATQYSSVEELLNNLFKTTKYYRNISKTAIYLAINLGGAKRLQTSLKSVGIIVEIETCKTILAALWEAIPEVREYVKRKQKEANTSACVLKPEELTLLVPEDVDWDDLTEEEAKEARKKPVEFGKLICASGFSRYVPKYHQLGFYGNTYVSTSISDISATEWMSAEGIMMMRSQSRFLQEYIIANNYHLTDETGYAKVWLVNTAHDEIIICARDSHAETSYGILAAIMREEWHKMNPSVEGVESTLEKSTGKTWADIK